MTSDIRCHPHSVTASLLIVMHIGTLAEQIRQNRLDIVSQIFTYPILLSFILLLRGLESACELKLDLTQCPFYLHLSERWRIFECLDFPFLAQSINKSIQPRVTPDWPQ